MNIRNTGAGLAALALVALHAGVAAAEDAHWSYEGEHGPERWGEMAPENTACAIGAQQSPIDITDAVRAQLPGLEVGWAKADATIVNNGHTIQIDMPAGSTLARGGTTYELLQFHFHAHSEHLIDGKAAPMEVHFVHRHPESGALGVLGVMMEGGGENATFAGLAQAFPQAAGGTTAIGVDPNGLLPAALDYWAYEGSLTTPPCSEVVNWMVARTPIAVGDDDIARFKALFPMNARPPLPINRRFVLSSF